ncbi:hypothetical protein, partial [Nostoc sp.]
CSTLLMIQISQEGERVVLLKICRAHRCQIDSKLQDALYETLRVACFPAVVRRLAFRERLVDHSFFESVGARKERINQFKIFVFS